MKRLALLVWLTQLGLTVALPFAGFILLALWLQERFSWGNWVLWIGIILGILCAIEGFRTALKTMSRLAREDTPKPPVSYNEHD